MSSTPKVALMSSLDRPNQRGGAYLRVDALIKIYKRLGFSVTVFYMEQWNPRRTIKAEFAKLYYGAEVRILFSKETVDLRGFEFIHFDNLRFFQWNILRDTSSYLIYNAHNLEFENYYSREQHSSRSCMRFKEYEVGKVNSTNLTFVCSDRERNILANAGVPLQKLLTIPNLVEKSLYRSMPLKKTILFLGTLDYYPNIRAVDFLCSTFFPALPEGMQHEFEFLIAGRNPSVEMKKMLKNFNITVRENLSQGEIYEILSRTLVSLVPLDHGSGTRLKIVESLFSGASVLSTPLGAEGFEGSPGLTICELNKFTEVFINLITNGDLSFSLNNKFIVDNDVQAWIDNNLDRVKKIIFGEVND